MGEDFAVHVASLPAVVESATESLQNVITGLAERPLSTLAARKPDVPCRNMAATGCWELL